MLAPNSPIAITVVITATAEATVLTISEDHDENDRSPETLACAASLRSIAATYAVAAARPMAKEMAGTSACSTPSGIRGGFTRQRRGVHPEPAVLNAFRHQRRLHSATAAGAGSPADVLNAFRHQRRLHSGRCAAQVRRPRCAQRLPASEAASRDCPVRERHRRACSTPSGIRGGFTVSGSRQSAPR